jgi:hypothetical protein
MRTINDENQMSINGKLHEFFQYKYLLTSPFMEKRELNCF